MLVNNIYLFVYCLLAVNPTFAQVDYNDYIPFKSSGKIPEDFLVRSYKKIEADRLENRTELKNKQEKIFLEGIHYSIDELLHSGNVTFGDRITRFINLVADRLLHPDPTLRSQLRFYTLKSNAVNAFSTDQGIVFVTTGLISRLDNEAQLAFVLAHEITHYNKKHVLNSFDFAQNKASNNVYELNSYSRDNEFEADALGLKMYLEAGYNADAVQSVFDVLMYSHLPNREKEWNSSVLSTYSFVVPNQRFSMEKYPIRKDENYNDQLSSHPNIQKRRENIFNTIGQLSHSDIGVIDFGNSSEMKELKKIALFESVRIDIINGDYVNAINTIYLLEESSTPSVYLERMKAAAWLGLYNQKINGDINQYLQSKKEYEGSVANFHEFLSREPSEAINSISLRMIYTSKEKYPKDDFILSIWESKINSLVTDKKFVINKFDSLTFQEALANIEGLSEKDQVVAKNTLISKYYRYGMADIVFSENFKQTFDRLRKDYKENLNKDKEVYLLSKKERKRYESSKLYFGLTEIIMLEPQVVSYTKKGIKLIKSEKLSESFLSSIIYCEQALEMNVSLISSKNISDTSINEFNENALLDNYLTQLISGNGAITFPIDNISMKALKSKYNTSTLLLTNIEHYYKPNIKGYQYGIAFAWPPMAFIFFPIGIMSGNNTAVNYVLIDLDNEKILSNGKKEYHDPVTRKTMKSFVYDILCQLHTPKM